MMAYVEHWITKHGASMMLAAGCFLAVSAFAQDEAIPKPKPKATTPTLAPRISGKPVPSGVGSTILVSCDLACVLKIDGERNGHIEAAGLLKVRVELGAHILAATTDDGKDRIEKELNVKSGEQTIERIDLKTVRAARLTTEQQATRTRQEQALELRQLEEATIGIWTDPSTGLSWTKQDNGRDVTWPEATDYCRNLRLTGHGDWRLATIDELQGIYDAGRNIAGQFSGNSITWHVKGDLRLSGWQWSSSQGNASGEAWIFLLDRGERYSSQLDVSSYKHALCVRGSGK